MCVCWNEMNRWRVQEEEERERPGPNGCGEFLRLLFTWVMMVFAAYN